MQIAVNGAGLAVLILDLSRDNKYIPEIRVQPGKACGITGTGVIKDEFWVTLSKKQVKHLTSQFCRGAFADKYYPQCSAS